jgi:hypothetical protein
VPSGGRLLREVREVREVAGHAVDSARSSAVDCTRHNEVDSTENLSVYAINCVQCEVGGARARSRKALSFGLRELREVTARGREVGER